MRRKIIIYVLICISVVGLGISGMLVFYFINTDSGSWQFRLTDNKEESMSSCAMSSDGKYIVVGSGNDHIYLFEKSSSTPQWSYRADDIIIDVDMSANGQYIVACVADGILYVFDRTSSTPIWSYSTGREIGNVGISADGNYIFACDYYDLLLFSRESNIPLWIKPSAGNIVEISGNGSYLVSIYSGLISFFSKSSSTPLWQYDLGEPTVGALTITPNGEFFAAGGQNNQIHIFNKTGSAPIHIYSVDGSVRSLSISDDGNYISAGCSDGCYLFEKSNPNFLWRFLSNDDGYQTAISSDGIFIAFGGVSYENIQDYVYLFHKNSSNQLWEKKVINRVGRIKISSDGNTIAVAAGFNFYLLKQENPTIDESLITKLSFSFIALGLSGAIGASSGIAYFVLWRFNIIKERKIREKAAKQKEVVDFIEVLDEKYQAWEDKESEEESKV